MSEADARTFVVRVTRHDHVGAVARSSTRSWLKVRREALEAVRKVVEASAYVEVTDGKLLPETAGLLGLKPGVAKAM
jgi:hypothetical protein